jgi:tRNA/rRNA methyltransferase
MRALSSQIDFILVRPQFAGNVGAAARAMKNAGFRNLILVKPAFSKDHLDLPKFAVGAIDLIHKASVFENLGQALASHRMVIGTSRRKGAYRKNFISLQKFPLFLKKLKSKGRIAILFGTEANGLSNEELEFCQHLLYIPSDPEFESFNLAQAVLLVAYELFRSKIPKKRDGAEPFDLVQDRLHPAASVKMLEGMYTHLTEMLTEIGFLRKSSPYHMPRILRNILGRAHLTDAEVRVIRGICRQVLWYKGKRVED